MKTDKTVLFYAAIRESVDGLFIDPLTISTSWDQTDALISKEEKDIPLWCYDNPFVRITTVRATISDFDLNCALDPKFLTKGAKS